MTQVAEVLRTVAPKAKANYMAAFAQGDSLLRKHDITTRDRLAHFLAQVLHETGGLVREWENMNYSASRLCEVFGQGRHSAGITLAEAYALAYDQPAIAERVYGLGNPRKAQELGNVQPDDGFRYRGGGLMQTTGRANYRRMGQRCGVDFEIAPELIVSAAHALKPALAEWSEKRLNSFADVNDLLSISRAINLGNPRSERVPNGLQDRATWFAKVRPLMERIDFAATPAVSTASDADTPSLGPVPATKIADLLAGRVLSLGDSGPPVRAVQLALAKLGYDLKGTGYFGGATDTAVTDFQRRHALEIDGEVGRETAAAIDRAVARPKSRPASDRIKVVAPGGERPLWLIEGLKWRNTEEAAGPLDNPQILDWARQEGGTIAKVYRNDSIPWCSLYANMVLTKVGLRGTETLWALDWAKWGIELPGMAVGAFAPMKRDGGGHIAIVVGRDQHGNLMCLGGNQSDCVNIRPFPAERPLSFRWPEEVSPPPRIGFERLPLVRSDGELSRNEQ
jgi:uncharacterized protein (TIGR02594 family)